MPRTSGRLPALLAQLGERATAKASARLDRRLGLLGPVAEVEDLAELRLAGGDGRDPRPRLGPDRVAPVRVRRERVDAARVGDHVGSRLSVLEVGPRGVPVGILHDGEDRLAVVGPFAGLLDAGEPGLGDLFEAVALAAARADLEGHHGLVPGEERSRLHAGDALDLAAHRGRDREAEAPDHVLDRPVLAGEVDDFGLRGLHLLLELLREAQRLLYVLMEFALEHPGDLRDLRVLVRGDELAELGPLDHHGPKGLGDDQVAVAHALVLAALEDDGEQAGTLDVPELVRTACHAARIARGPAPLGEERGLPALEGDRPAAPLRVDPRGVDAEQDAPLLVAVGQDHVLAILAEDEEADIIGSGRHLPGAVADLDLLKPPAAALLAEGERDLLEVAGPRVDDLH